VLFGNCNETFSVKKCDEVLRTAVGALSTATRTYRPTETLGYSLGRVVASWIREAGSASYAWRLVLRMRIQQWPRRTQHSYDRYSTELLL